MTGRLRARPLARVTRDGRSEPAAAARFVELGEPRRGQAPRVSLASPSPRPNAPAW